MCCCLPPCFWWLCFTPRALRTIGDPRSPEEIERQRKRREERARRRRWWRCQRAPPDGERNGETATGQVASRGGEIELGEIRVVEGDGRLQNYAEKEIGPADPWWHELVHSNPAFDAPVPPFVPLAVVSEPRKTNKHHLYRRKDYLLSRKQSRERERATRKAEKELARSGGGGGGGRTSSGDHPGEITPSPRESAG